MKYESGNRTKHKIFYSSERLFYENGYENTTVDKINKSTVTTKSSFYLHYQNKLELGMLVNNSLMRSISMISSLFGSGIDEVISFCLEIETFWYVFFQDENIKRFIIDLSNEDIIKLSNNKNIFNICLKASDKNFSNNEFKYLKMAIKGIGKQMIMDSYAKLDKYTYECTSNMYLIFLFKLFDFDTDKIDQILTETNHLFSKCLITNNRFYVTCCYKD
ncbi:MAG: helix-turn-helix domain-containing protein [Eubacteriaceae bacterium]